MKRRTSQRQHLTHTSALSRTLRATVQSRPPINGMSLAELRAWIVTTREGLLKKMRRERAYLDRRAVHGTSTAMDEAYESDQLLEADVVALLDEFEQYVALLEEADPQEEKERQP